MIADDETRTAVRALIDETYRLMSTPGSAVASVFGRDEIAIAGSGQGELWSGSGEVVRAGHRRLVVRLRVAGGRRHGLETW